MLKHKLYTVGYTSFATYKARSYKQPDGIDFFIQTLKKYSIYAVVDVRSNPYSAGYEQFNKDRLSDSLKKHHIYYLFFGNELGARPPKPELYTSGQADFEKMCKDEDFLHACKRIHDGLVKFNICLLCAECNPIECHRAILVANSFRNLYNDVEIFHILNNKSLMSQNDLDQEVMKTNNLPNLIDKINKTPLQVIVANAYKEQSKKVAYKL